MCGIAGYLGDFDSSQLAEVSARIAHRGPDDQDIYVDSRERLALVHRRLAIIDLSPAGRQPMWDVKRRAVIIFNGEIYNYRELARDLRRDGYEFGSATDTEVILNLYLRDGLGFLSKLTGIFAFALWDVEKRQLLLARDGVGVKPLYYYASEGRFAFASEIKALMALREVDRTVDVVALSQYLTYLYCPAPRTPLANVLKLEPGGALLVSGNRIVRKWSFWRLPATELAAKDRHFDTVAAQEKLEALLARAVKRQMISDVPVGAFLSGGLDSSSLVVFARQYAQGRNLDCFTIGFRNHGADAEGFPDDLPYAQRVAKHLSVSLNTIWSGSEMAKDFESMVYQLDEPQPDPAALNVLQIARLAQRNGTKVLLSGAGGDDIFGGYRRHRALQLERLWSWMPQMSRSFFQRAATSLPQRGPRGRRIAKAMQFAGLSAEQRAVGYFAWLPPDLTFSLFSGEARRQLVGTHPFDPFLGYLETLPTGMGRLDQMLQLEQRFFLPDHNLNYTDKMGMAAGVEVRVPFLDPDLMVFAAALPESAKQHGAVGKWLFKRTMETHLPGDVIYRPKAGFGAPLRQWMKYELREHFAAALDRNTIQRRGLFNPNAVSNLVALDRAGRVDAAYPLFGLVCIETWCRRFIDSN